MTLSYEGYDVNAVTFNKMGDFKYGTPCRMNGDKTVSPAFIDKPPMGFSISFDDKYVTVQTRGFIEVPFSQAFTTFGFQYIVADGQGGIKPAEKGFPVTVIYTTAKNTVGIII